MSKTSMLDKKQAMDRFLASVEERAYMMARFATSNSDDALDIVQDAMLVLVKQYANKEEKEWKPLFYTVLQNRIRDWYRRESVRNRLRSWFGWNKDDSDTANDPLENFEDPAALLPEDLLKTGETMSKLTEALTNLPIRQQQVFLLRAWEGLSEKDTAQAMNCSKGTAKTHYSRALGTLRQKLEGHWP